MAATSRTFLPAGLNAAVFWRDAILAAGGGSLMAEERTGQFVHTRGITHYVEKINPFWIRPA